MIERNASFEREYEAAFLRWLAGGMRAASDADRKLFAEREAQHVRAMGTQSDAAGAVLVPQTWAESIAVKMAEDWLYGKATRLPCANKLNESLLGAVTFTGVAVGGSGEATAQEVSPTVTKFKLAAAIEDDEGYRPLELRNFPVIVKAAKTLIADCVAVGTLDEALRSCLASALSKELHRQFVLGTHADTTEVMGLVQYASTASRRVTSAGATTLNWTDVLGLVASMTPAYFDHGAEWIMSPGGFLKFIAPASGTAGTVETAPDGTLLLMGKPLRLTAHLDTPASGGKTSLILYQPRNYVIAEDLYGMRMSRLDELYATTGQSGYVLHYRCDAAPLDPNGVAALYHT